jgi:hypothetical protein
MSKSVWRKKLYEVTAIFLFDKAKDEEEAKSLAKAEMIMGNVEFNVRKLSKKEFKDYYSTTGE